MKIVAVDILAVCGNSYLHRVHTYSKLLVVGIVLISLLITKKLFFVVGLGLMAGLILSYWLQVPLINQGLYYSYPLSFSIIYGLIIGMAGHEVLFIAMRAMVIVMVLLVLITTTPYIRIFSALNLVLPNILVDVFFLTYRCFFLIVERIRGTLVAIRLKGGMGELPWRCRITNLATCLGLAIVRAMERNERSHWIMMARGYSGGIKTTGEGSWTWVGRDMPLMAGALAILLVAVWS